MSDEPWRPERAVDPAAAAVALGRHLDVDPRRVRRVDAGWDNLVLEVDGVYLRVAVRALADPLVRREQRLLPTLGDLPLAAPRPLALGEPEPGLPGPWIAYRPVEGEALAELLGRGESLADPEALARALAELHRPARAAAAPPGTPRDPLRRADPAALAGRVLEWTRRAVDAGVDPPRAALLRLLDESEGGPTDGPEVLVHGDLHMRHVLVDGGRRPVGVIDWGDACLAPPVGDLAVYWYGLTPDQRPGFLAAYGAVEPAILAAARRWAAFSCLALAAASAASERAEVLAGAREGLRRTLRSERAVVFAPGAGRWA
ncbi:MAG: phosphotransferase [Myxococcales bacterium]|nr:phosphotransferase [Myxococcales bacterium]